MKLKLGLSIFAVTFSIMLILTTGCSFLGIKMNATEGEPKVAVFDTNKGRFVIELYPDKAPKTVANFEKLISSGFYDGLTFHRYVEGFVIQGGDPKGDGTGGPGYTIPDESNDLKHDTGMVGMAKTSAPNSAGSQFYICLPAEPGRFSHLDGNYCLFGKVIRGMDVVESLRAGDKMMSVKLKPRSNYAR